MTRTPRGAPPRRRELLWPLAGRIGLSAALFVLLFRLRIHGIDRHFWLLGDQVRDWGIALAAFSDLPLVGPATHVGGYTIGPAFYWILWCLRITFGPWFENLPHAGGIGQAAVQSAADVLLLFGVWRQSGSLLAALAVVVLLATAAYDLCLSALVWNPTMGAALVKMAIALVLLGWWRSPPRAGMAAALAWCAVHAYTGAIFATLGVLAALVLMPFTQARRREAVASALAVAGVIAVLQLPLVIHQVTRSQQQAMGAVTGSLARIAAGEAQPQFGASWQGLAGAFTFIQGAPWERPWQVWILVGCAAVMAWRCRRQAALLAVTVLPLTLAVVGYALYVGDFLDRYYYLSLMPSAVMTVVLGITALPTPQHRQAVSAILLIGALALTPSRVQYASALHRLPQYGVLLDGSRDLARRGHPVRRIRPLFTLPATTDPHFLFRILGGRLDPSSSWTAIITATGKVAYRQE